MYNKENLKRDIIILSILVMIILFLKYIGASWFCPFHDGIGIPCPGCGFTSAVFALLRFDLSAAWYHHPLVFIAPLIVIFYFKENYLQEHPSKNYGKVVNVVILMFFVVYILRWFNAIPNSAQLTYNYESILAKLINLR